MSEWMQGAILGAIQGLTEFLPLSSSGHLVLLGDLFGLKQEGFLFDITLHLATWLAVVWYFRRDLIELTRLWRRKRKVSALWQNLLLATLPAIFMALLFLPFFEKIFGAPQIVSVLMIVTGFLFLFFEHFRLPARKDFTKRSAPLSLTVGLAQALALLPGISRSGLTIGAAIFAGVKREEAVRFSFLLSLPLVFLAGFYSLWQLWQSGQEVIFSLGLGIAFVLAFLTALLAIEFLLRYLRRGSLLVFAWYLWLAGSGFLFFSFWR